MSFFRHRYLFLTFVPVCILLYPRQGSAVLPRVSSGTVVRIDSFQTSLVKPRTVDIWLPDGYPDNAPYAVCYFQDGQMLFDSSMTWNRQEWRADETFGRLMEQKRIRPCIVVGVFNGGARRHAEYFPQKPFESLSASYRDSLYDTHRSDGVSLFSDFAVCSDDYLKFLVRDLKPYVDSVYRTDPSRSATFVAGSSMGGLISLYAMCEYPDVYGGAACLSTHWTGIFSVENNPIPEAFMDYLYSSLPPPSDHRLYFDRGDRTLDALYEPYQSVADAVAKARGYTEATFRSKVFPGADHSERSWSERLDQPILFLLGK
ncbi:MAG: hypothetical protein RL213_128 [Bacteroidota bacterium]|jgi:enterochelin esterase-like enzyme